MQIIQSRRDFLASAVSGRGCGRPWRPAIARRRGPPEIDHAPAGRYPRHLRRAWYRSPRTLLRAEGFTDIRYVPHPPAATSWPAARSTSTSRPQRGSPLNVDAGEPITALAGVHPGCFELFAHEPIRTISDLKGKRVGIPRRSDPAGTCSSRSWRRTSGSIPKKTSTGSPALPATSCELFAERQGRCLSRVPPSSRRSCAPARSVA